MTRTTFILTLLAGSAILAAPLAAQRFARGQQAHRDPIAAFREADTNGDGAVSRAEYAAARLARFEKLDRNGDGAISRDDFGRLIRLAPRLARRIDTLLAAADTNYDGRVTRAEYAAAPMPLFDRLDVNHDGRIDGQELAAARAHVEEIREELETYRDLR
ncbi:MAG TPA: EF-hand domain-containing protein [Sphingobium sp.]